MELTKSMEDYLEKIYEISINKNVVRITDIAKSMNIKKSSVSQLISKLKIYGLVDKEKYGFINLTDEGLKYAKSIRERHIMLSILLSKVLKIDKDIAENDACLIEHVISEQTICKLKQYLKENKLYN